MARLEAQGITKRFGGVVAVDDVSLTAADGRITALIGPNGAGKTTLFNVINGFDRADSGSVVLDGQAIARPKPWRMCRVGVVRTFQLAQGFPSLSVWDNMMVAGADDRSESMHVALLGSTAWRRGLADAESRAVEILERLDLWDRRDSFVEDLSAGEVRLVEFARQLMASPRLLMLDEPASGVDPSHISRIAGLIRELNQDGITVLVIDHNLAFIMDIADYVYVLSDGRLLCEGPPAEVARDPRVIETYIGGAG